MSKSENAVEFAANMERFTGFADTYDRWRPKPPEKLAEVLCRLVAPLLCNPAPSTTLNDEPNATLNDTPNGEPNATLNGASNVASHAALPRVVDLGCGTGLSTRYWHGRAAEVIGVEPTAAMRVAAASLPLAGVRYVEGFSHATGLADDSAQIVTCSQALHWMEPQATFAEAARVLVKGGVFAAFDYDWPPFSGHWQLDAAYSRAEAQCRALEAEAGLSRELKQWDKAGHLQRMNASGAFRWTREILLHHEESGDAERLVGLLLSQGSVQTLLKAGYSEDALGISELRQTAFDLLGQGVPSPWLWCSRLRVGVV